MVITEYRADHELRRVADFPVPPVVTTPEAVVAVEERPRDVDGHCWDGRTCDHEDHGDCGTIHFIR
jgi:hypothetical protein